MRETYSFGRCGMMATLTMPDTVAGQPQSLHRLALPHVEFDPQVQPHQQLRCSISGGVQLAEPLLSWDLALPTGFERS